MRRWGVAGLLVAMLAACSDDGGTDWRQTCATMGRRCGVDDFGTSCGTCAGTTTCNVNGVCVAPGATPCTPSCAGATCGASDRCGGQCFGPCPSGQTCSGVTPACAAPMTGPTTHDAASGRTPLFPSFYGVPFTVPASTMGYAVSSPSDTFNVGIFTAAEWTNYAAGGQARAYILRENIRTASEVAPPLPAGNYVLGFRCRNLIERCIVTYAVTAYY